MKTCMTSLLASLTLALCLSSCDTVDSVGYPPPRVAPLVLNDMPMEAINMGDYEILPDYIPPYYRHTRAYSSGLSTTGRYYYPNQYYQTGGYWYNGDRRIGGPDYENKYN